MKGQLQLTNLDKLYWPKEGITKGEVIHYYEEISPYLLPHLKDRPQTLKRFPEGIEKPFFFQKNLKDYPDWIETVEIEHEHKIVNYLLIQDLPSLLWAVNLGCIEFHPFFSRWQNLNFPDYLTFDLDPVDIGFNQVIETSLALHTLLESLKVHSYCKTSGSRGLHISVPLHAEYTFEQAKTFAQLVAGLVHNELPSITSLQRSPQERRGKVYIDYLQNNPGQTLVAPYSLRAKPGAPISTPLAWEEVKKGIKPTDYTMATILSRLKKKGDLMTPLITKKSDLKKALEKLEKYL